MKKSWNLKFAALFLGALLWASSAAAAEPKKVRLAYVGWEVGAAIAYIGIDGGVFKQNGIEVEEIFIRDLLAGGVQSLIGADFVIGFGNPLAIVQPVLAGSDIVSLCSHVSVEPYGMAVTDNIGKVADLKGKRIGVSELGGRSDLVARVILRRAGLDPANDVEVVSAGMAPNRILALSKNLIQGAPLNQQFAVEAKKLGVKILDVKEIPIVTALLMTTRSFIRRDEDTVRRFIKGYVEAIHFYLTRRPESMAIIKKYFSGSNPAALDTMYEAFAAQLKPLPLPDKEAAQAILDTVAVVDPKSRNIKPGDLFDSHFLEELKASGFMDKLYAEKVRL
ncbi:MAG TPA: ABC transporter substrate-binding protein [Candidatus Binatia bacterium]|jgi:ABC-type nitrate/sulfonate/bicarbonate transport system substrate-binding protein